MKVVHVAGARPNFMKIAPLMEEMSKHPGVFQQVLVHTGQHYDYEMSDVFFRELGIKEPDIYLGVGSGTQAEQTAKIMMAFEPVVEEIKPDMVIVVGDVNSTIACALVATKLLVPVSHVEAGLRSFDRTMPEEINRVLTDQISDYLFTTERSANENLLREGRPEERIFFVGNVMIDTLKKYKDKAVNNGIFNELRIEKNNFALLTLHRPSNVDDPEAMKRIIKALKEIQQALPVVFPVHPRTLKRLKEFGLESNLEKLNNLRVTQPLSYLNFLSLLTAARLVLTDSGGIQEETTILGVPCLTLRENTERPVTVTQGTNQLVGTDTDLIVEATSKILNGQWKKGVIPELWDGKAASRIVEVLSKIAN